MGANGASGGSQGASGNGKDGEDGDDPEIKKLRAGLSSESTFLDVSIVPLTRLLPAQAPSSRKHPTSNGPTSQVSTKQKKLSKKPLSSPSNSPTCSLANVHPGVASCSTDLRERVRVTSRKPSQRKRRVRFSVSVVVIWLASGWESPSGMSRLSLCTYLRLMWILFLGSSNSSSRWRGRPSRQLSLSMKSILWRDQEVKGNRKLVDG